MVCWEIVGEEKSNQMFDLIFNNSNVFTVDED